MSEKCIITNRCFTDEFDLPLYEESANDFYTAAEIQQEVEERIVKLCNISTSYRVSADSIVKYEFINKKGGIAEVEPVGTHKYVFRISKQAARKGNEKYLDTIIYHELCHTLQVDFLLSTGVIYFEDDKLYYDKDQKDVVNFMYEADEGHTKLWYSFAKLVNAAFVVNPPVDRYFNVNLDVSDTILESTFKRDRVILHDRTFTDDFSWLLEEESDGLALDGFYDYFPEAME